MVKEYKGIQRKEQTATDSLLLTRLSVTMLPLHILSVKDRMITKKGKEKKGETREKRKSKM